MDEAWSECDYFSGGVCTCDLRYGQAPAQDVPAAQVAVAVDEEEEITEPGVGPAADYPRLVVTKGSAKCYLCGRETPGLLERSAFDRMACCGECCWDLGYEADQAGHLRRRETEN